jgi:hypothetical protein
MGTPFVSVTVVAKVCLAMWKVNSIFLQTLGYIVILKMISNFTKI